MKGYGNKALMGIVFCAISTAAAAQTLTDGPVYAYRDGGVWPVAGAYQIATALRFEPGEIVEAAALGDSEGWRVEKIGASGLMAVKPVDIGDSARGTNLIVSTKAPDGGARRYVFTLALGPREAAAAGVSFLYARPAETEAAPIPEAQPDRNRDYVWRGAKPAERMRPLRVDDDGAVTRFVFHPEQRVPAIFAVGEDGSESLLNLRAAPQPDAQSDRGAARHVLIADGVRGRYVLRDGDLFLCIRNRQWRGDAPSELAQDDGRDTAEWRIAQGGGDE